MSYDSLERSRDDGQPIFLYSFALGTTVWRYTSSAVDHVAGGFTWISKPISDDGVKQSGEATSDALTISAPIGIAPVQHYLQRPPSQPIRVKIFHMHVDNTTMLAVYAGEVSQIDPSVPGLARITCETISASMKRTGLRLGWQRTCPYAVYDELTCKVNKAAFATAALVVASADGVLTVELSTARADHYFSGGFVEWVLPVRGIEFRAVEMHVGNSLLMFGPTDDIYPGLTLTAYPGCNGTSDECTNKFSNYLNHGGIRFMPGRSPFDGTPIF